MFNRRVIKSGGYSAVLHMTQSSLMQGEYLTVNEFIRLPGILLPEFLDR
jgi:hypothetical protein